MDEALRIQRLKALALDRIKQREVFERIAALTADSLHVPMAAISIIEEDREWFLGQVGLPIAKNGREHSFCSTCLAGGEPLVIDDASADPRFAKNPLVQRAPHQRSYMGAPLKTEDGAVIGTLWCASPEPAAFKEGDLARLTSLAQLAEQCLNAHAKTIELARANASLIQLNTLFRQAETAAQIGSWRVDL